MNNFETPSWGEEKETEKWEADLFSSYNVKRPKTIKKRKRNKYPKGFNKADSSQVIGKIKNDSKLALNNVIPETSDKYSHGSKMSSSKRKKKSAEPPGAAYENINEPFPKIGKSFKNSRVKDGLNANPRLSTTPKSNPKKKKSRLSDNKMKHNKDLKTLQNNLDTSFENEMITDEINNSTVKDGLNANPRPGTTPKSNPKKKKKSRLSENKMNHNKDFKTVQNKLNMSWESGMITDVRFREEKIVSSKKLSIKDKKTTKNLTNEQIKTSDECNTKLIYNSGEVVGKKRKHLEDDVPLKKKKRKTESETVGQIEDVSNDSDIQTSSCKTNEKLFESKNKGTVTKKLNEVQKNDSCEGNSSLQIKKKKLTLREKMLEKLRGSRFRFLNEQLYTSESKDTNKFFLIDPKAFEAYHEGYKQQLMQWPVKPIDLIIKSLMRKPASYVIADFGCGDAQIAQSLPNKVHSFDHIALNDFVTVCDMAHTPLKKGTIDVVVFCLSLMGSNLSDYICEANRVLKIGGLLKIAEVESRFDNVDKFVKIIDQFGFLCIRQDSSNDYFYLFDFRKEKNLKEGKNLPSIELRACTYKKR